MKKQTFRNCILEIENHFKKGRTKEYKECVIGQTNNAKRALFIRCNLPIQNSWYIYRNVGNSNLARKIVRYFIRKGMKQYSNLIPSNATYVFCYINNQCKKHNYS